MEMNKIINYFYKRLLQSKISKVFLGASMISLTMSMINKTNYKLLGFELFIYLSLAMTANCLIYGKCKLSAYIMLLFPISLILINILEFVGVKKEIPNYLNVKEMISPSFLKKTEEEKKEHIQKLKNILKRNENQENS